MLRRSFERQTYEFRQAPRLMPNGGRFGVYVNVPLCHTKCSFCPFYKELFTPQLKDAYLGAIVKEIEESPVTGEASWVYFGGGTPNTLSVSELGSINDALRTKISSTSWGIELLPGLVTGEYLEGLKSVGFSKISIGVESFDKEVVSGAGRQITNHQLVSDIVSRSSQLGLWSNTDVMVGLPSQTARSFLEDIAQLANISPSQVTIYPYMVIRGLEIDSPMSNQEQFQLIESAAGILSSHGYSRKGVWVFARGEDVYDSSRDELISDYIGFGPAAFSTYGEWKVVNPELDVYLKNNTARMAFVAPKTPATDDWRRFARMMYDMRGPDGQKFPGYIKFYITVLKLAGYIRNRQLTDKGVMFAHEVTKSVVEALPFPLQNPGAVTNYEEYLAFKKQG